MTQLRPLEINPVNIQVDIVGTCRICKKNPLYSLKTMLGITIGQSICDDCQLKETKRKEQEEKQKRITHLYEWSNLPKTATIITFGKMLTEEASNQKLINKLEKETIEKHSILPYIYVSSGVGKTHLSYCFANRMIIQNYKHTYFVNIPNTLWRYRVEKIHFPSWALIPILIIDDLWNHTITNWSLDFIYEIIDNRIRYQMPTLITSNTSPFNLKEYLFSVAKENISTSLIKSLIDRIFELCEPIEMNGNSKRTQLALTRKKNEQK